MMIKMVIIGVVLTSNYNFTYTMEDTGLTFSSYISCNGARSKIMNGYPDEFKLGSDQPVNSNYVCVSVNE